MKTAICLLLLLTPPRWLSAAVNADGAGFFPVVVIVATETGSLLPGAMVVMEDAGRPNFAAIKEPSLRRLAETIGQSIETDARGSALLFYYGRWSSESLKDGKTYSRQMRGRIVVRAPGFERAEQSIADAVGAPITCHTFAPVIYVTLKRSPAAK